MQQSLRDYISARRLHLEEERDALRPRLDQIMSELAELDAAESGVADASQGRPSETRKYVTRIPDRGPGRGTIAYQALVFLCRHGGPATAAEITDGIRLMFGRTIQRVSLSPQLSRLASSGWVWREGRLYSPLRSPDDVAPALHGPAAESVSVPGMADPEGTQ